MAPTARSHPRLPDLSRDKIEMEVSGSRQDLEQALGTPIRCFAYPYGSFDQTREDVVEGGQTSWEHARFYRDTTRWQRLHSAYDELRCAVLTPFCASFLLSLWASRELASSV